MNDPKYPNQYGATDEEIEVDQTVRAANKAWTETDNPANSDTARDCYEEQARALEEHARGLQTAGGTNDE